MDNDLISRSAIYDALRELADKTDCNIAVLPEVAELIREVPAIDPESLRPHGRWVPIRETRIVNGHTLFADGYECSACHEGHSGMEYCERCGARMDIWAEHPNENEMERNTTKKPNRNNGNLVQKGKSGCTPGFRQKDR